MAADAGVDAGEAAAFRQHILNSLLESLLEEDGGARRSVMEEMKSGAGQAPSLVKQRTRAAR